MIVQTCPARARALLRRAEPPGFGPCPACAAPGRAAGRAACPLARSVMAWLPSDADCETQDPDCSTTLVVTLPCTVWLGLSKYCAVSNFCMLRPVNEVGPQQSKQRSLYSGLC